MKKAMISSGDKVMILLIISDHQSSRLRIHTLHSFLISPKGQSPWFTKICVLPCPSTSPYTKTLNYQVLAATKEKPQAQNGITHAKAQTPILDTTLDLLAVSTFPRNVILANWIGIFWLAPRR